MEAILPVPINHARAIARNAAIRVHALIHGIVSRDDLESEAWIGLLRAVPRYDPSKSCFGTYGGRKAYWHLLDYLRASGWVPRHALAQIRAGLLPRSKPWRSLDSMPRGLRDDASRGVDEDAKHLLDTDQVRSILGTLKARDRRIMTLYFLDGLNPSSH